MTDSKKNRPIRSFVRREGRLTAGQERAFEQLWPRWGIDFEPDKPIDLAAHFGNGNPVVAEIGFGNGESLLQYAQTNLDINYLGIEVHAPGVGHLLLRIDELGLTNTRIMRHDAVEVLPLLGDNSLQGMMLFFPDPWHKKRHHKRRILKASFIDQLARLIVPGGFFHAATDWQDYADQMLAELNTASAFINTSVDNGFIPRPESRPLTKFEARGERLGHGVWDLIFQRSDA